MKQTLIKNCNKKRSNPIKYVTHLLVATSQESKKCSNSENPKNRKDIDLFGSEHFLCFCVFIIMIVALLALFEFSDASNIWPYMGGTSYHKAIMVVTEGTSNMQTVHAYHTHLDLLRYECSVWFLSSYSSWV